jgi:archaemetzincin
VRALVFVLLLCAAAPAGAAKVCLQPLGPHDAPLLPVVARGIDQVFGMTTEVLAPLPMPEVAWYEPRKRWRAEKILEELAKAPPAQCNWVMGFTREDVSTAVRDREDWGVLGLAYIGGRVAVVSSFRMKKGVSKRVVAQRAVKVVNHELGHAFGMDHDDRQAGCIMNDAKGTVRTVDRETGVPCAHERETFERLLGQPLPVLEKIDWALVIGR